MDSAHYFFCGVVWLRSFGSLAAANHRQWFLGCSYRPTHVVHASRAPTTHADFRRSWHRFRTHRRHRSRNGEREHSWLDRHSASLLVSAPQIRYSLRHGRGPGISPTAWAFLATSSYLWFAYGIGAREVPVIANSGIAALLGTAVVIALLVRPQPQHLASSAP